MREVEFRLDDGDALRHKGERRALTEADWERFADWIKQYHDLCWLPRIRDQLLDLGRQIHSWLDGPEFWIERLRDSPDAPVIAEFVVRTQPDEKTRCFLEVPWELAADGDGHLAAQQSLMWAPVRRIGLRADPLPPNKDHRLGVMFMAAAPLNVPELNFEAEEAAVLRATERVGLDLIVEDSGNLNELGLAWKQETLDVLHVSCHGMIGFRPILALEGLGGELQRIGLDQVQEAFAGRWPKLLFLSACHTGQNEATTDSLALGLVCAGFPAVLAWADSVGDADASAFAAEFYRQAADHAASTEAAWALARFRLLHPERSKDLPEHWHVARLFVGPRGGGPLATGHAPRLRSDPDAGRKDILEARGGRIQVASRFEFVGRRREIQTIAREFRHPNHAGILIHGFGRQGKSSLAARIIDRHPELAPVVLFQQCDGPSVLAAIRAQIGEAADICDRWRDRVDRVHPDYEPDGLYHAMRELFEGPCGCFGPGKPILLLLDDLEALLDPPDGEGYWRAKADVVAPLAAIIRAFDQGGTVSRLLITSRYEFRLSGDSHDPALRLLALPLPETSPANRLKQANHKILALGRARPAGIPPLTRRAIAAARGNAGLQDLLFRAVLADPAAGEAAIRALEDYLGGGALPEQAEMRATLEKLVVDTLLEPLIDGERALLRVSTLFQLPVPLAVWGKFAAAANLGDPDRLLAFGLWERVPDIFNPRADAAGPNAISAARLRPLPDAEAKSAIGAVLPDLFAAWGGADRLAPPYAANIELTRLALMSTNLDVLDATAALAVRGLQQASYRQAAATATAALDALDKGGYTPEIQLLLAAAESFNRIGDPIGLRRVYADAAELVDDNPSLSAKARLAFASFRRSYAGYLQLMGEPDRALTELRTASAVFEALGDRRSRAMALGDIAQIMAAKGEVERALALHRQELKTYETLADHRSRAITLGQIADIMTDKGEFDEALKLHNQTLQIVEALGDRRARAKTLSDIARIMTARSEIEPALGLLNEARRIFETLGDLPSRAGTLGDIARIMFIKGRIEEALALHQERLQTYEVLGDRRSRAIALGEIARIMEERGEVDAAIPLHRERLQIFETLGDRRERAGTLGDIARIMIAKGQIDAPLELLNEALGLVRQLGDREGIANIDFMIGMIHLDQGADRKDALRVAVEALAESYRISLQIGRVDMVCVVGKLLGQVLARVGLHQEARVMLQRALDGFRRLRRPHDAAKVKELLQQLNDASV